MANKVQFKILADIKDFTKGMKGVADASKKVTKTATIAFAAFGASIFAVTKLAKEQQKVMNQTRAVIRSTGGVAKISAEQVFELGKQLQNITTFGDETIVPATNLLLTFKEIGGTVIPRATKAILDMSTAMNQGLKESAIQLGKALNDPILGLTAMRRVGIQFTKTQEDLIKSLVKMGKTAEAQDIILTELESQFGGSAEAAREGLGAIDGFTNALSDLGETIGLSVAPTVGALANKLTRLTQAIEGNESLVLFIGSFLLLGTVFSGIVIVAGLLVTAIATIGTAATATIAAITLLTGTFAAFFVATNEQAEETTEKVKELFSAETFNGEAASFTLDAITIKMGELGQAGFLLGEAVRAGLAGLTEGGITVTSTFEQALTSSQIVAKAMTDLWRKTVKSLKKTWQEGGSIYKDVQEDKVGVLKSTLGKAANLNKGFARAAQAIALGEAIFNTAAGVTRALKDHPFPLNLGFAAIVGAAGAVEIATIASQSFAVGTSNVPRDMTARIHKGETIISQPFAESIRSGDLSLSGPGGGGGGGVIINLEGAVINGISDELVEDIFTKASENIFNNTLAFTGAT